MKKKMIAIVLSVALCLGFVVSLQTATNVSAEQGCWIWNEANDHYYILTDHTFWEQAEAEAVELGGHLVTINDAAEELWLKEQFGLEGDTWIGFNDIDVEGTWVWASGEPVTYTNWNDDEPNNAPPGENIAVMNAGPTFGWNDLPNNFEHVGIVETTIGPVNEVHIGFGTHYNHNVLADDFKNKQVTDGEKSWHTGLQNWEDTSCESVNGVTLALESTQEFDYMNPDPDSTNPSTWLFGTVDQGAGVDVNAGSGSGTFTPGFDASRRILDDKTIFMQSDGIQQLQTVYISFKPLVEWPNMFDIRIDTGDYPLVDATIHSVSTSEGFEVQEWWDGRYANITVADPGLGNTFEATIEIWVTPNLPKVEYIPRVEVGRSPFTPLYTTTDNLILLESEIGTWTWDAVGDYEWLVHTEEVNSYGLSWQSRYNDFRNHAGVVFSTRWEHRSQDDTFVNSEVDGIKQWFTHMDNSPDPLEPPINSVELILDSEFEFDHISPYEYLTQMGPPTYNWYFGDVPEGHPEGFHAEMHMSSDMKPNPFPVTFMPGFHASRSFDEDKIHFLESEGMQLQKMTITLTPIDADEGFSIWVNAEETDLVNAVIVSPTTNEEQGIWLDTDRNALDIWPTIDFEIGETYTWDVVIEVTPNVDEVWFVPHVNFNRHERMDGGTTIGSSVSGLAHDPQSVMGDWTWNADGTYVWDWNEALNRKVAFHGYATDTSPVAVASIYPHVAAIGSPVTFDGSASFAPGGTIVSYEWDFGDGNQGSGVKTSHTYTLPKVYETTLTVEDNLGDQSSTTGWVVVYDPEGGFVTGGGWFESPGGAFKKDPSLTGKAVFGFVSKYKKGANIPSGQTEFQFKVADLNFHSTSYNWLIVSPGGTKARFRGSGTINGSGNYQFHIWVDDGDPDTFRIKIWEKDDSGSQKVIYENGPNQPIGGGSIIVHTGKK